METGLGRAWVNLAVDLPAQGSSDNVQIMARLQIDPKLGGCPEIPGQTQCGLRCDGTTTANDVVDA